ncbi:endolytic transglycosylase MltG [bacterium]|nr:endolytic transglycosylase MltG [bacterium]
MDAFKSFKKTNYLYFVSNGKGEHRFSRTYSLHKKNIKLWKDSIVKDKQSGKK